MYIKLFSNCIPVKGFNRAIICDLQRHRFDLIPNDLFDLIVNNSIDIKSLQELYEGENLETLEEYFKFLVDSDYGFFCSKDELNHFPPLDLTWDHPSLITNAILDVDENSNYDLVRVLNSLEDIGCKDVQMRFFCKKTVRQLEQILENLLTSSIKSIQFILPYSDELPQNDLIDLCSKHLRIVNIVLYSALKDERIKVDVDENTYLIYLKETILNEGHCGLINVSSFAVNVLLFTESISFNSCLNRKLSVDVKGNIKNCPSMPDSFGHVSETDLRSVLRNKHFKRLWSISKDQISICKDCEFRHICTDCRAYLENPEDELSKPLKCGYSPYTNQWEDWSVNPLKQQTIRFYGIG